MTKPTGRPRGRPRTKEYVTLMARMDVSLADRVKRYAAAHRQPISVVIRDAVTLLMEEYPAGADLSGPRRLAAHEFLSDRYESLLDTLLGEADNAGLEELLSDTNEGVVETILSEENRTPDIMSDTNEGITYITSDNNTESPGSHRDTSGRTRSRKASDRKAARSLGRMERESGHPILSDTKAAISTSPQRKGGRPSGAMRQRILTLLAEHPEGLSAEQIRAYLQPDKPIGDTLQGMRRNDVVTTRGRGRDMLYFKP